MSAESFILLIIGLTLVFFMFRKSEWYQAKVQKLLSVEVTPSTFLVHKITLIIGCILGVILAFISSVLKPYEDLTLYIMGALAIGTILYFTFTATDKKKGALKGVYYVITTFLLLCTSIFGVILVIILVFIYLMLKFIFGALLGNSGSSGKKGGFIDFLFDNSSSDQSNKEPEDDNFEITDENGYTRELKKKWGSTYTDDKGDDWEEVIGGFRRKEK